MKKKGLFLLGFLLMVVPSTNQLTQAEEDNISQTAGQSSIQFIDDPDDLDKEGIIVNEDTLEDQNDRETYSEEENHLIPQKKASLEKKLPQMGEKSLQINQWVGLLILLIGIKKWRNKKGEYK